MAKRRNPEEAGIFQKIGMLSDLTSALSNQDLKDAFENLGNNGVKLYELFATAVYDEIETLMKGETEEAPQVMYDVSNVAYQLHAMIGNLCNMMVQLGGTPAMQPLNLIAERLTGTTYNPAYAAQAAQQYYEPAPPPPQYQPPQQPMRRAPQPPPQPEYEEPVPMPPRPQQRQAPPPQQPPQQPQQPPKRRQYGEQPAPQPARQPPGPAATNRPAAPKGNGPAAPGLPPRGNRISGLF